MKTPRLALIAFLAFASAPAANASLPTWPVVDEGFRAWPTISFKVGNSHKTLRCKYSECDPAKNKAQSNLYVLKQSGGNEPIRATIYKYVERSKWNPRYHTDGPYDKVPEVIDSHRTRYTTELSNFKLDNSGKELVVVQGGVKYPATTDINTVYVSATGAVIAVQPPAKTADDVVKPGESTPPPSRGIPGKPPVQPRRLHKLETAGKWRDNVTGVGEWRAIQTSKLPVGPVSIPLPALTFYCYHEKMGSDKTLTAHLIRHPYIVECVSWTAPKDDATQEASGKKFKVRNHHVQFDLAYVDGKLVTMNTTVPNVTVTEKPSLPDALGGASFVKVTAAQAPEAPTAGGLVLDAVETRWLTKPQAADYAADRKSAKDEAARKAVDDKYRALVKAQIRPEASAAYAAAAALPAAEAPAKIKEAIEKVEMWGGAVRAVVAPFQEKPEPKLLEVQLSKAEWDVLKSSKNVAALRAYEDARAGADGNIGTNDKPEFNASGYDAVALHLAAEAARKAAGPTGPVVTPPPGDGELVPLLTDAEKKLLTPEELASYNSIYNSAPAPKEKDKNLQNEAKRLRDLIAKEGRGQTPPYVAPTSRAEFDKLPDWQKRKFCSERGPTASDAAGDVRATDLGGSGKAKDQLQSSANAAAANGATTTTSDAPASDWTVDACKPYRTPPVTTTPGGGKPTVGADVPLPVGKDMENPPKEKSKWLTQDLLTSAAKGALVGLLIGSLFGPVGLVAGPLLGAAAFYGLTKITS